MSGFNFALFGGGGSQGQNSGVNKYPNAASLPASAADGDLAIVLDTNNLYSYDTGVGAWVIIGGPGVAVTDSNTDSIGMSFTANALSANLRIPPGFTGVPGNFLGISFQIFSGASPGLVGLLGITGNIASGSSSGFLLAADWTTFNNKQPALGYTAVPQTRVVGTTFPVLGGGDLTADRQISMNPATGSTSGFLSNTDWTTFNNKVSTTRAINTTFPLLGGGDLSADRTLSIPIANGTTGGYLSATDWNTFNGKQAAITVDFTYISYAKGLTLNGSTLTAGWGDTTNPGMVGPTHQVWSGDKRTTGNLGTNSYLQFFGASLVSIGTTSVTTGHTLVYASPAQGSTFSSIQNDGLGFLTWKPLGTMNGYRTVTNAGATLNIQDRMIEITTGATNQTLNVGWAAAGNTGVPFTVMKIDSGLGSVTIQSPDLINGVTNFTFYSQWECHTLVCNGLGFRVTV